MDPALCAHVPLGVLAVCCRLCVTLPGSKKVGSVDCRGTKGILYEPLASASRFLAVLRAKNYVHHACFFFV